MAQSPYHLAVKILPRYTAYEAALAKRAVGGKFPTPGTYPCVLLTHAMCAQAERGKPLLAALEEIPSFRAARVGEDPALLDRCLLD
jgi:hypothetical protein